MTLRYALTDDQLGQYYRKMNTIADRLGKSLPFDQVMAALQSIHDGKEPVMPTLIIEPRLASWRKFLIGGVAKKPLLQRVKSGFEVGSYPESIVNNRVFTTQNVEESIDTIILEVRDFDYTRRPTTTELFDPARLAEWSKQNQHRLPEGYDAIELLPAEAGLHIRDQYKDQPKGEVLWMAMERITGSGGGPRVFSVERDGVGAQWLDARWASPQGQWSLGNRIVFRLRKKVTQD
jgi:hypothetical protein